MKKTLFLAAFLSLFMFSCNQADNHEHDTDQEQVEHTESTEPIQLNKGEKWDVNDEMKPFVHNGSEMVNNYIASNDSNYKALATSLEDQNSKLISSCTMDGESHDELHKWLHPHLDLVKELAKAPNAEAANKTVMDLQESYKTFNLYFY